MKFFGTHADVTDEDLTRRLRIMLKQLRGFSSSQAAAISALVHLDFYDKGLLKCFVKSYNSMLK
jgi:hypothetical protein